MWASAVRCATGLTDLLQLRHVSKPVCNPQELIASRSREDDTHGSTFAASGGEQSSRTWWSARRLTTSVPCAGGTEAAI